MGWHTSNSGRTSKNGRFVAKYSNKLGLKELELTITLDDDAIGSLCCQFPITADYDGVGMKGSKFAFYL